MPYPVRRAETKLELQESQSEPGRFESLAEALAASEALKNSILASLDSHIAVLDREGNIIAVNAAWSQFWKDNGGAADAPGAGTNYLEVCRRGAALSPDAERAIAGIQTVIHGTASRFDYEYQAHSPTERRWFLMSVTPTHAPKGGALIFHKSTTELRRAQLVLHSFSRRLIEAQERERSRVARELHDDIVQRLAMLTLGLEQLRQHSLPSIAAVRSRLAELCNMASDISGDVQALSHQLHSPKLEHLGVVAAMRSCCGEMAGEQHVDIDYSSSDVPAGVHPDISLCLFRVLQEALRNGFQHGGATRFTVRLAAASGELRLSIRDYGKGFDVEAGQSSRGLGLTSMRERCLAAKGTMSIRSKPGWGTEIIARVPLNAAGSATLSEAA